MLLVTKTHFQEVDLKPLKPAGLFMSSAKPFLRNIDNSFICLHLPADF
jgi:hypothetical protein